MKNQPRKPGDSIVGLVSWVPLWGTRLGACLGTLTVLLIHAWSWWHPPIESWPVAGIAFVVIVGASYLHFAALIGACIAVVAFARRMPATGLLAALGVMLSLLPVLTAVRQGLHSPDAREPDLTVYSANLLYGRADLSILLDDIRDIDPDVILLQESTPSLEARVVELLAADYPHIVRAAREDAFGETTLSRLAFTRTPDPFPMALPPTARGKIPQIGVWVVVPIEAGETAEVEIWNVHTLPPVSFQTVIDQDRMARGFVEIAHTSNADAVIFAGDFNSPEAGPVVRRLTSEGFDSAHQTLGAFTGWTWPAGRLPLARTRIDQMLSRGSPNVRAMPVSQGRGSFNGSDHLPIWTRFDLTAAP